MDKIKDTILKIEQLKLDKKFKEAILMLEESISIYHGDYRLYEELSDIYLYETKLDKALTAVDYALELNPESATGNYLKGFILLSQEEIESAIIYLEKSNSLMGNNSEVLRNLGWAYTMVGQTDRGITILKRALNIAPEDELITEDLAMALIGSGHITEGNSLLKRIGK